MAMKDGWQIVAAIDGHRLASSIDDEGRGKIREIKMKNNKNVFGFFFF